MSENVNEEEFCEEEELGYDADPELSDDDEEGTGDPSAYDENDSAIEYDPSQFELPEDYSEEDEDGDEDA